MAGRLHGGGAWEGGRGRGNNAFGAQTQINLSAKIPGEILKMLWRPEGFFDFWVYPTDPRCLFAPKRQTAGFAVEVKTISTREAAGG